MIPHPADAAALAFFLLAWVGYTEFVMRWHRKHPGLNTLMHERRRDWMREMSKRKSRQRMRQ